MSIYVGGSEITEIKIGATTIREVYVGSQLVWAANHRLTQGRLGTDTTSTDYRGVNDTNPSIGSISPSTLNGATILGVFVWKINLNGTISFRFSVRLAGNHPQNFFTSVSESSLGTKYTNNLSFHNNVYNISTWSWDISGFPSNWDGSGVLELDFA